LKEGGGVNSSPWGITTAPLVLGFIRAMFRGTLCLEEPYALKEWRGTVRVRVRVRYLEECLLYLSLLATELLHLDFSRLGF